MRGTAGRVRRCELESLCTHSEHALKSHGMHMTHCVVSVYLYVHTSHVSVTFVGRGSGEIDLVPLRAMAAVEQGVEPHRRALGKLWWDWTGTGLL